MEIRDRYAPSPTGPQHIGGVRTALFNYLFACSTGGKFILRLEDTDQSRSEERYVQNLYDTFEWLGFRWDEGPDKGGSFGSYIQSERTEIYQKYAGELLEKDCAYRCFCTSERLDNVRKEREKAGLSGYDRFCRSISKEESQNRSEKKEAFTIRLKIPLAEMGEESQSTSFYDHIIGQVEWKNEDINPDPVLLKSDGFPTYHLANVVDDHLMEITHILRAQEWLPSVPLHVIMYRAFGWEHPKFCHLPMVMGLDGKKLSKRHGSTSIDEFRKQGILPDALINYVAMVGASYEEGKDIYTLDELAAHFSIDKLNKAPGIFDYKKLEWFNGQYIRMKTNEELANLSLSFAMEAGLFGRSGIAPGQEPDSEQKEIYIKAMSLIKERLIYLTEIPDKLSYIFRRPPLPPKEEYINPKSDPSKDGYISPSGVLERAKSLMEDMANSPSDEEAENILKSYLEKEGIKLGDFMMPLRIAITGSRVSPHLFGSIRLLGKEESMVRLEEAIALLG